MTTRLEVIPVGVFSRHYEIQHKGRYVGRIENLVSPLKQRATLTEGARKWFAFRESAVRTNYTLESAAGEHRARAEKQGWWRELYRVNFGATEIFLRKKALAARGTFVLTGAAVEIGSIVRENPFSRRLLFQLTDAAPDVSTEICIFLIWVALRIQTRSAAGSPE